MFDEVLHDFLLITVPLFDRPSANMSEALDEELGFRSTYWTYLLFMNIYNYFQSIIEKGKLISVHGSMKTKAM